MHLFCMHTFHPHSHAYVGAHKFTLPSLELELLSPLQSGSPLVTAGTVLPKAAVSSGV